MPRVKLQDGVGLVDADFNGSFVLECVSFQRKRVLALGPHTIPFPRCTLCASADCALRQRLGVVFVNLIDRGNEIASMIKQNIIMDGRGVIATGAAVALIDSTGVMCAFGDAGHEYNNLPLAVTNLEGTEDMASADRFGWVLPHSLTRSGEHSRAAAVRALRECVNFAVEESQLQPLALWETAWPAHPNRGPSTRHELFVVWRCDVAERHSKVSLMAHGDRRCTWIPVTSAADPRGGGKGFEHFRQRAQSEFCKFVVDCLRHRPVHAEAGPGAAAAVQGSRPAPLAQQGRVTLSSDGIGAVDAAAGAEAEAEGSGNGSSCEEALDSSGDDTGGSEQEEGAEEGAERAAHA